MRERKPARILGPYEEGDKWRFVAVSAKGRRKSCIAKDKQGALRKAERALRRLDDWTAKEVVKMWTAAKLRSGVLQRSASKDEQRVTALIGRRLDDPIRLLTRQHAELLYAAHAQRTSAHGRPFAAATHQHDLHLARSLWTWAIRRDLTKENPWQHVELIGRASRGKLTLTATEAEKLIAVAHTEAEQGSGVAVAALCCILLGTRAGEALGLVARDLDGQYIVVRGTKTSNARRRLKAPPLLLYHLQRRATGKAPADKLLVASKQGLHATVGKLCEKAGVPRVCTHALRGTWATLSVNAGASVEAVSLALGHGSIGMTLAHYVSADAATNSRIGSFGRAVSCPAVNPSTFGG